MANAPLTRAAVGTVPCDIEHGLAEGASVTAPGGQTFTTAKTAPLGGEVYLLKQAGGVSTTLPAALSALGYTAPDYELVSGRNLVFGGAKQAPNSWNDWADGSPPAWLYIDSDGVLCRIYVVSNTLQCQIIGPYMPGSKSLYSYSVSLPSVSTALDAKDNGGKALVASRYGSGNNIFDSVELYTIWEITLSGPAASLTVGTAVVASYGATNSSSNTSAWVMYDKNSTTGAIDTTTATNVPTPQGHGAVAQTAGSSTGVQNSRLVGARYDVAGNVEIIYADTGWTMTYSGSWSPSEHVLDWNGVERLGAVGSYSQTYTLTFSLRANTTVIDSTTYTFSASGTVGTSTSSSTKSYGWGGSVGHVANQTRTATGTAASWTYFAVVFGQPGQFTAPTAGDPRLGGGNGYQYMELPTDTTIYATYTPIFLVSGMRQTNKCYAIFFTYVQSHLISGTYYNWICRLRVARVCGINNVSKFNTDDTPLIDWVSANEEDRTIQAHMLAGTQHPVTYTLATKEALSYNWNFAYI